MKDELFKEDIVHADESELRVLKRDGKPTNSVSGMWVFCSGAYSQKQIGLYKYHPTRSSAVVREVIGEYSGYLHTDGYSEYNTAPGGSKLYQAVNYSLNHKTELEGYLADGRIEMTNNRAERAVKPFVIARKNFLFSDTSRGAESSALCFSMIESAKLNNLNVYVYLIYLFSELPKLGENPPEEKLTKFLPLSRELPSYCKKV